jgi:hypothetical protein
MSGFFGDMGWKPSAGVYGTQAPIYGGVKDLYVPHVDTPLDIITNPLDSITRYVRTLFGNVLDTTQKVNDTAKLSEVAFGMAALGATVVTGYIIYKVISREVK